MMKEFGFEFDDEIFEESNCGTNRVEETQCDPEVSLKGAFSVSSVYWEIPEKGGDEHAWSVSPLLI